MYQSKKLLLTPAQVKLVSLCCTTHVEAALDAPHFEDLWGYKVAWRLREDGWCDRKRRAMIILVI